MGKNPVEVGKKPLFFPGTIVVGTVVMSAYSFRKANLPKRGPTYIRIQYYDTFEI